MTQSLESYYLFKKSPIPIIISIINHLFSISRKDPSYIPHIVCGVHGKLSWTIWLDLHILIFTLLRIRRASKTRQIHEHPFSLIHHQSLPFLFSHFINGKGKLQIPTQWKMKHENFLKIYWIFWQVSFRLERRLIVINTRKMIQHFISNNVYTAGMCK